MNSIKFKLGLNMLRNLFWVISLLLAFQGTAHSDAVQDARKPVDRLNAVLIDVMKGGKQLGFQGRYKKLEPVVKDTFEFEAVSLIALGSHWKKLDVPQKTAFMEKMSDLSVATYAAQFKDYGNESFKYQTGQEPKPSNVLLTYTLESPNEKEINFEYVVRLVNGQWRIINIIVDGISDLAIKKAQYTSVIDREGFDALLEKLKQKIGDYAKNNAA
jgi:phospholipid transport system substrate-binding protein